MSKIITGNAVNSILSTRNRLGTQEALKQQKLAANRKERDEMMKPSADDIKYAEQDYIWATRIGHALCKYYPGHGWQVEVDIRNGVAKVFNCHMSGIMGYLMHLKNIRLDTFDMDIMRIGGEILEAFGLTRGKMIEDEVAQVQRDRAGSAKVDL